MIYDRNGSPRWPLLRTKERARGSAAWTPEDWARRGAITRTAGAFYGSVGAGLLVLSFTVPVDRPIEGTRHLERLAYKAERASRMPIETAVELAALTRNPKYDCRQMRCTPEIAERNAKARNRLQIIAAAALPPSEVETTGSVSNAAVLPASLHQ